MISLGAEAMDATRIFVDSEFARLRTVVLAECEFRAPDAMPLPADLAFLPQQASAAGSQTPGRSLAESHPDVQRAWEAERKALAVVLRRHQVEVLRPRKLNAAEKAFAGARGYANFFTRDPFFTIGPFLIEGSLRFVYRRIEVLPARDLIFDWAMRTGCLYVAVPQPAIADDDDGGAGPFLEGGDILILGRHVFVGQSGLASNDAGIRWLANLLRPMGYTVEGVRLRPDVLHLDCALSLVRPGVMVVCEDAFLDGVPSALANWTRIAVGLDEVAQLAVNGLPVTSDIYITDPAFAAVGEALARHGVAVEYVDFAISRSMGGGFRCSTQPLLRAD